MATNEMTEIIIRAVRSSETRSPANCSLESSNSESTLVIRRRMELEGVLPLRSALYVVEVPLTYGKAVIPLASNNTSE